MLAAYVDLKKAFDSVHLIFAESLEVLVMALEALHEEAKPLGLEVSWLKTKVQVFGDLLDEAVQSVHACGEDIEILENFPGLCLHPKTGQKLAEKTTWSLPGCGMGSCKKIGDQMHIQHEYCLLSPPLPVECKLEQDMTEPFPLCCAVIVCQESGGSPEEYYY
ncbi:hypothetical protein GWK47_025924 [Chionoecetes opilio]|uniref:Single domain-containing protein n=1 Tax=Chionoecetes opilio TaxID=41210 RepID=A0A8J8WEZ4_CHIOP|nr:hypothetical protein GWK47_025924 [Chionoecetes opilio]